MPWPRWVAEMWIRERATFRYGGTAGKDFNYRIYGMGDIRGPEFHSDGDGLRPLANGPDGFPHRLEDAARRTLSPCRAIYTWGERRKHLARHVFSARGDARNRTQDYVSGGNLLARWQHTTGEGSDIQIQAYFDRTNRQDLELGETRDTFDVDFIQHARIHSDQELTWGLGARVSPSNFIQTSPGVNFLPNKQTDSIYSGFVQYELPIVQRQAHAHGGHQAGAQQLQRLRLPAQRAAAVDADAAPVLLGRGDAGGPDAVAPGSGCSVRYF